MKYIYRFPIKLKFEFTSKNNEFIANINETLRKMGATDTVSAKTTMTTWYINMKVDKELEQIHLEDIKNIIRKTYSEALLRNKRDGITIEVGNAKMEILN